MHDEDRPFLDVVEEEERIGKEVQRKRPIEVADLEPPQPSQSPQSQQPLQPQQLPQMDVQEVTPAKANRIQFNQVFDSQQERYPHLIKSSHVPESRKAFNADIVRRGELPERKPLPIQPIQTAQAPAVTYQTSTEDDNQLPTQKDQRQTELEEKIDDFLSEEEKKYKKKFSLFSNYQDILDGPRANWLGKPLLNFTAVSAAAAVLIFVFMFFSYGFQVKTNAQDGGQMAIKRLMAATAAFESKNYDSANSNFEDAIEEFGRAQEQMEKLGGDVLDIFSGLPFLSKLSSGKNLVEAGNELAKASYELAQVAQVLNGVKNPFDPESNQSLTDVYLKANGHIKEARGSLVIAEEKIAKVDVTDLPDEYQAKVSMIKKNLPIFSKAVNDIDQNSQVFLEILGHNGPRKYLLLFQNNHEMRATGGFVGSYGILHISDGRIKELFIDGIYNPDWHLSENVIPPKPIQKISAGWSTHDANWFPHFPTSAEKISWFYEKTGGPTVDGIITLTPTVLQKMLEVTGPINMEEYEKVISSENFMQEVQQEVEVDFDKEENQPKQILADLAPQIIGRLFEQKDPRSAAKIMNIFSTALKEKHILLHSTNEEVQGVISKRGWSGEVLQTEKDYLMVINSNINGFKTDGVIDEEISHSAEIQSDGSVVNTVKVRRYHRGGDTGKEWHDQVNANYMRVYVPKGSELLEVKGQTREFTDPPVDYEALGFATDSDVLAQEMSMQVDHETGTRVYKEENKTVFANWTYVSPKETMEIEYKYKLPFKVDLSGEGDSYSILFQKQAGSINSRINSVVKYDSGTQVAWQYPRELEVKESTAIFQSKLERDSFVAMVLEKRIQE